MMMVTLSMTRRTATSTILLCILTKRTVMPLSTARPKKVAIIGGGIAGLSCASALQQSPSQKLEPIVFDTGRLRPGGRCSSRFPGDRPNDDKSEDYPILSSFVFDHAAQIITINNDSNDAFDEQVLRWKKQGIVKQYPPNSVCELIKNNKEGSKLSIIPLDTSSMYHGVNGMGNIPLAMAKEGQFHVEQDVWVPPSNGVKYIKSKQQWKVKGYDGDDNTLFDYLVIAHNGKCADRLMSKTPAKALHSLLRVNFSPTIPKHGGKRMTLNSIYSLTFCVKAPSVLSKVLSAPFTCGFIDDKSSSVIRLVSCQINKYPPTNGKNDMEIWTLLSSPKFAKKYKAPQENLPPDVVEEVTDKMLASLDNLIGQKEAESSSSIQKSVLESRLQLWGAAVPLNTYKNGDGFVYDAKYQIGVCGDWLVDPSITGAWESGQRLAEHIIHDGKKSIGLPSEERPAVFQVSESVAQAGIGSVQASSNKRELVVSSE